MPPRASSGMVEEMNDSEKQFRQMIDEIPALAWSCLPDGSGEFLNKQWLDYTGLSTEAAPGLHCESVVHPDDLENLMNAWRHHLATAEPIEVEARLRRFDGEYRWFLFRAIPVRDSQNNVIRWYGTNTDIDDRKQMEARLQREKVELRLIIDTIPQYIIVLEPDGKLLQVNRQVLDYSGFTTDDVQSPEFRTRLLHPDDWEGLADERRRALAQGEPFELELRSLRKDGQYRWFLMKYNPRHDEQGRVVHWYATGTDITERKETAEALLASENFARGQVEVLKSTLDALAMESAPERLVGHMLRTITVQFGAHSSSVWRRDEPTGMIGFEFAFEDGRVVTKTDARFAGMDLWLPMEDFWPWPEVFRTGKPSVIEDIRTVPLGFPVRKTSGQGQKSSMGSQRSMPANLASVFVTTRPSSKANSKPIMPVGSSRRQTLLLCAPNCTVMVRNICPTSRSGADSIASASRVLLSTSTCPRAKFSDARRASAVSFRSVISVPVAYQ